MMGSVKRKVRCGGKSMTAIVLAGGRGRRMRADLASLMRTAQLRGPASMRAAARLMSTLTDAPRSRAWPARALL